MPAAADLGEERGRLARRLGREIARIDALVSRQVNVILHHPAFQRLEASWRGLRMLVDQCPADRRVVQIHLLNLSFAELSRDIRGALEFDQSEIFRKVYGPFDTPGGEPYGLLVGDYELHTHPDHIEALEHLAGVAAAAFAPFVAAASPQLLDLKGFDGLERPLNLAATFSQTQYVKWRALRAMPDTKFVALTLPHILMRLPYREGSHRADGFRFREDTSAPNRTGYLWGSAAYAYASVLIRAFEDSGWLADTRGTRRGQEAAGVVSCLPQLSWETDSPGVAPRCPTDAIVTDSLDRALGELGFLPLCWCQDTHLAAFHGCQSLNEPKKYDRAEASANARLSAMLPYVLCASRFAHYIKVMMRDKTGSLASPADLEDHLGRWLNQYTSSSDGADAEMKARFPLRDSRVEVREVPGAPGRYTSHIHLRPQFQLDHLVGFIELKTRPDGRRS
jgi:type VI secretion system ImpC/EvpB family protein